MNEQNGLLRLKYPLPNAPTSYAISISAYLLDKSIPASISGRATLNLTVVVSDSNNHCPAFDPSTLPSNFEIRLNSRNSSETVPIFTPKVFDRDKGENGRVMFKLAGVDTDYFGVDENNGEVSLCLYSDSLVTFYFAFS